MTTPAAIKASAATPAVPPSHPALQGPYTAAQPEATPAAGQAAVDVPAPATPAPAPTAVTVPAAPTTQFAAHPSGARIGRGVAAEPRLRLPAHIGGLAGIVVPPALVTPDFAAADVRRPMLGVTATLGNRPRLVTAAVALLTLLAASGSFLLLADRIRRGGAPRAS